MSQDSTTTHRTGHCPVCGRLPETAQTRYMEVIAGPGDRRPGNPSAPCQTMPFQQFTRIIDVCCLAGMLRNFNIASLRDDEIPRFLELQSFFFSLESRCLDEAGFE